MNNDFEKTAKKVSLVSIIGNFVLSIIKLFAGIIASSSAMISDAIHSASDVFSTFVVIIGIKLSLKKPDKEHPYGHERLECVAAIILSMVLFVTGAGIGLKAFEKIISGNYDSRIMSLAYVLPLEEGSKLTIDDKEFVAPKGQVCLLLNDKLSMIPFWKFHRSEWVLPRGFGQKAEYMQFMQLPYYNKDGNVELANISGYDGKQIDEKVYNKDGILIKETYKGLVTKNYEYNSKGQLIKVYASKTNITEYSYDNNKCTKTTKRYCNGFEKITDENSSAARILGYKKDNLMVMCLNPQKDPIYDNIIDSFGSTKAYDILEEIDKEYQTELEKNPKLNQYDVFIDMYDFGAIIGKGYRPIVTVKDKSTGEVISVKQGYFQDKNHQGQTYFGLDCI